VRDLFASWVADGVVSLYISPQEHGRRQFLNLHKAQNCTASSTSDRACHLCVGVVKHVCSPSSGNALWGRLHDM
jgi:hypothetical protein